MNTEKQISDEHITNNKTVRNTLISRGIVPENIPPAEDIKRVERKLQSDTKKALRDNKAFKGRIGTLPIVRRTSSHYK